MPYDKSVESIVQRLREHEQKTSLVLDYYKKQDKVLDLKGTASKTETYNSLKQIIEQELKKNRS